MSFSRFSLLISNLLLLSCAGVSTFTNRPSDVIYLQSLIEKHESELNSYAALLRVKASRDGKVDDFRTEIFSERPRRLSIYVRGFLGKSAFKAVSNGDSLLFYFTDSKEYFMGDYDDLMVNSLEESRHIVSALRALFRGSIEVPSDSLWEYRFERRGDNFTLTQTDRIHRFEAYLKFETNSEEFPHIKPKRLEIKSHDESFRSVYEFQSYSFNKTIPASKFEIEMSESAYRLSPEELVVFLTDLDP